MSTLKERVEEALRVGFKKAALARAAGISSGAVSQWISGSTKSLKGDSAAGLAELTGRSAAWWASGKSANSGSWKNPQRASAGPASGVVIPPLDQQLSHPEPIMVPRTIDWESLMSEPLPPFFRAVLPDDAMGIDYPKGAVVNFTTTELPARARDLVLVADSDGAVYFREFQQGRGDKWQAVALVSGYAPLDSESDGLRVLAISMGRWGRRG